MNNPPQPDQVEVVVFGPGYGESILVHLGDGHWVVVDSCMPAGSILPAPLQYLETLNLNPADAVKLIVISHWHDDHIRGLSEIVRVCDQATVCMSTALGSKDFIATVAKYEVRNMMNFKSGAQEIFEIQKTLKEAGNARTPIKRAVADRPIYWLPSAQSGHGQDCGVYTLSPSDDRIDEFMTRIGSMIPKVRATKSRLQAPESNHNSVVLMITVGDSAILLGADLEETMGAYSGWSVIAASGIRPQKKSSLFKVPHHGSVTGHCDAVWDDMLEKYPIAVLSPWTLCGRKLPSNNDIDRIKGRTPSALSTTTLPPPRRRKRHGAVDKIVESLNIDLRESEPPMGIVRLRNFGGDISQRWSVEMFGPATQLEYVL